MLSTKLGSMIPLRRQIDKGAIIALGQVVCFPSKINAISNTQCRSLPPPRVLELSKELDSWEAKPWNEWSSLCSELINKPSPGECYVAVFFTHPDYNRTVRCELGLVSLSPCGLSFLCCCLWCCWTTATLGLRKSAGCGVLHSACFAVYKTLPHPFFPLNLRAAKQKRPQAEGQGPHFPRILQSQQW